MTKQFARYESYKDSGVEWLGHIPAHWEIKKVKYVIKEHSGNGFPIHLQGNSDSLDVPFYKVSDINGKDDYLTVSNNYISHSLIKQNGWNYVPKFSIVTAKIGEALRKNHRKIVLNECVIDNNCIALESHKVNVKYNFYIHKVVDFDWFTNAGAVPSISVGKYKNFSITTPPIKEQQRIADFLEKKTAQIDEAIAQKEKMIELLKEYRQVTINNAVTKGLDPDVPMRDSGIEWLGQIPAHWEIKKLKYLLIIKNGQDYKNIEDPNGTYPVIGSGGEFSRANNYIFNGESILLGRKGTIDKPLYIVGKFWTVDTMFYSQIIPHNYGRFIYYQCLTINFDLYSTSTALPSMTQHDLNNIPFSIPQTNEQKQIVEYLDNITSKIETSIACKQSEIKKLKEYKATLIDSAVTGKIKV